MLTSAVRRVRVLTRPAAGLTVSVVFGCSVFGGVLAGSVHADPADDALAKLRELSRQAEQTTEAMHSAQLDLDQKLAVQQAVEKVHAADTAALDAARDRLVTYKSAVNKFAAATYMGGRTGGMDAILTAGSPQQLIDKVAVQRLVSADMAVQMDRYRTASELADQAEKASARSAAEAKSAADQAAAVRGDLLAKQSRLQLQIAVVKSEYFSLTPGQRAAMAAPPQAPGAAPEAAPDAPEAPPPDAPAPEGIPAQPGADPMAGAPGGGGGTAATAVQAALTQVGTPYSWGGAGPGGFDCSGLVMWAFRQAGIALPHSSQAQANGGQAVSLSELQPGDVLTFYGDASHSGIYVGDGMMIHSSTYGQPVAVVPMTASGPIHNARRY